MKKMLALLLLAVPVYAQTIAPSQIKPGADNQVLTTTDGKTAWGNTASAGVTSFNGRTGAVVPVTGDYLCAMVLGAVCNLPTLNYQTIYNNNVAMPQQSALKLISGNPDAVTCLDNPATGSTDCTIKGGGGSGTLITGTLTIAPHATIPSNTCASYTTSMTASVPAGYTVIMSPAQGTIVSGNGMISPYVYSVIGSVVTIEFCNNWNSPQGWNAGTYNLQAVQGVGGNSTPGGSYYSVQYNNGGVLDGVAGNTGSARMVLISQGSGGAATAPFLGQLTQDDILPAFAISSFTCSTCSTYEIGTTIASPTNFTASYTSPPTSAGISDGTHSTTLTTPFTSGSLAFSYTSSTASTTTFTLTAVGATTKTSTKTISWQPRTFYGVGTGGATGATASGTSAVLAGATGTLGTWGLGTQTGTVSVSPSGQYIYFLLTTSGHSFTVNGFGTAFTSTTISCGQSPPMLPTSITSSVCCR